MDGITPITYDHAGIETENSRLSGLQEGRFADASDETATVKAADVRRRAEAGTAGLMLMVAVGAFFDILQIALDFFLIGPFVNWLISLAAGAVFSLWISSRKKQQGGGGGGFGWLFGSFAIELIPGFDLLPVWTAFAVRYAMEEKAKQTANTYA